MEDSDHSGSSSEGARLERQLNELGSEDGNQDDRRQLESASGEGTGKRLRKEKAAENKKMRARRRKAGAEQGTGNQEDELSEPRPGREGMKQRRLAALAKSPDNYVLPAQDACNECKTKGYKCVVSVKPHSRLKLACLSCNQGCTLVSAARSGIIGSSLLEGVLGYLNEVESEAR